MHWIYVRQLKYHYNQKVTAITPQKWLSPALRVKYPYDEHSENPLLKVKINVLLLAEFILSRVEGLGDFGREWWLSSPECSSLASPATSAPKWRLLRYRSQ